MSQHTISILGCGWLGLPLSKALINKSFAVNGSTTSKEKMDLLKSSGINPFLISGTDSLKGDQLDAFFDSKVGIIDIPFKRTLEYPLSYKNLVASAVEIIEQSVMELVIFTSSTSVYPLLLNDAHEDVVFKPVNARAEALLETEQALTSSDQFDAVILRCGGMVGGTRKVGRILSGKKDLPNGNLPVNLIHLDDCIKIIMSIIEQRPKAGIYNAVCDLHPKREELYIHAARSQGYEPPQFAEEENSVGKVVSNQKIKEALSYQFIHPDPMNF